MAINCLHRFELFERQRLGAGMKIRSGAGCGESEVSAA
jgi:hypothetical protein